MLELDNRSALADRSKGGQITTTLIYLRCFHAEVFERSMSPSGGTVTLLVGGGSPSG